MSSEFMRNLARHGLDLIDDYNNRPRGLDVVLISDPRIFDPGGALGMESKIVRDYIPVTDTEDFVRRLLLLVSKSGRKIRTLVYFGHGNSDHFRIGDDWIDERSGDELKTLRQLAPWFAPDATVILKACDVGQDQKLLSRLSAAFGGVRVIAWTGRITVNKKDEEITENGNEVVCLKNACSVGTN